MTGISPTLPVFTANLAKASILKISVSSRYCETKI